MIYKDIKIGDALLRTYVLSNYEDLDIARKRAFIIICPGGAYCHCSNREAEAVAIKFNAMGYNCAVLFYSVSNINKAEYSSAKQYKTLYPKPQIELANAIKYVRLNCEELNTDSHKIAILGFSAGGHLVASLGDYWQDYGEEAKPNAMVLCYPVITSGPYAHKKSIHLLIGEDKALLDHVSLEKHVSPQTPPTYIWTTKEDQSVPYENSLLYADALRKNNVPFSLKVYEKGCHGLSLGNQEVMDATRPVVPEIQDWPERVDEFLLKIFHSRF